MSVPTLPLPTPSAPPPGLVLLPAPACEPPYDDEPPALPPLRLVPPPAGTGLRLVPPLSGRATPYGPARAIPSDLPSPDGLPQPERFARALVQRLLEVLAEVRPLSQLQRDTTPELFADLERALAGRPRHQGPRPGRGSVRSIHVQQRAGGFAAGQIAEVCATVHREGRAGALALRLEAQSGRWVCTQLTGV